MPGQPALVRTANAVAQAARGSRPLDARVAGFQDAAATLYLNPSTHQEGTKTDGSARGRSSGSTECCRVGSRKAPAFLRRADRRGAGIHGRQHEASPDLRRRPYRDRARYLGPAVLTSNKSSKLLVVENIDTGQCQVKDNLFDGRSPQVGDVLAPGDQYTFSWTFYFLGSCINIDWRAKDGSGGGLTHTGWDFLTGGWEYRFSGGGSLTSANPSNNPPNSQNNVEIIDR